MKCPSCGRENPEGAVFCIYCGAKLTSEIPKISRYTERRLVTVLFADIVGFTSLSEEMDPEEVLNLINSFFAALEEPIRKYEGTIDKYLGDAIMVLFGAPKSHENDTERAIYSAIEMQNIAKDYSKKIGKNINLSIGINTGLVVAGSVGGKDNAPYSVIGDAVNVAKRVQEFAGPDDIIVTDSVYQLANYIFDFEEIGPISVKGRNHPVNIYKVLSHKVLLSGEPKIRGILIPLVDRKEELSKIILRRDTAFKEKKGQIVVVSGDAGIGKSRMKYEIKTKTDADKTFILEGDCAPHTKNIAYWPYIEIFRQVFGIEELDDKTTIEKKIGKKAKEFKLSSKTVECFGELFGIYTGQSKKLDHIKAAARELIVNLTSIKPLLLIVEDVHWMDMASLEMTSLVAELIGNLPVFFMIITRSGFLPDLPVSYNVLNLFLRPLSLSDSVEMVSQLLDVKSVPEVFINKVLKKTEGNPFFIEEIVNHLVNEKYIKIEGGECKIIKNIDEKTLPASIQAIISSEIDRLPVDMREVLKNASVIGREFNVDVLAKLSGESQLEDMLLTLQAKGFVYKSKTMSSSYIFKHAFIRDVAYDTLLKSEKQFLHTKVGYIMEELFADRIEEYYDIISYHFLQGGAYKKAMDYLLKAAENERIRHLFLSSREKYKKALRIANKLKENDAVSVPHNLYFRILLGRGIVAESLNNWEDAQQAFLDAMEIAAKIENKHGIVEAINGIARIMFLKGVLSHATKRVERAQKLAFEIGYKAGAAESFNILANINIVRGELDDAIDACNKAMKLYQEVDEKNKEIEISILLSKIYKLKGIYKESLKILYSALKMAKSLQDKHSISRILSVVAEVELLRGKPELSRDIAKSSMEFLEDTGDKDGKAHINTIIADSYVKEGEYGEGLSSYRKALDMYYKLNNRLESARVMSRIAEVLFYYIGDKEESLNYLKKCIDIEKEIGEKPGLAISYVRLSDIYIHNGQYTTARNLLSRALKISEDTNIANLFAKVASRMSEVEFYLGKYDESLRYLSTLRNNFDGYKDFSIRIEIVKRGIMIYTFLEKFEDAEFFVEKILDERYLESPDIFVAKSLIEHVRFLLFTGKHKEASKLLYKLQDKVFSFENKELYAMSLILKGIAESSLKGYKVGKEHFEEGIALGILFLPTFEISVSEFLYGKTALEYGDQLNAVTHIQNSADNAVQFSLAPVIGLIQKLKENYKDIDIIMKNH